MILNIKKVVIVMNRIIIIGSGPAGLMCALNAKTKNNEVIVLEKKEAVGKKILVTGSGKCNYWNDDQDLRHYHSRSSEELDKIINEKNLKDTKDLLDTMIVPYIRDGYYYPYSREAMSVRDILVAKCNEKGIVLDRNYEVSKVEYRDNMFFIDESLICDKLVIATGSMAYYQENNDTGYNIAREFKHEIVEPLPSLVQLTSDYKYLKDWEGVRSFAKVTLYENDNKLKEETGEVMLTNYGLSGICVFNLSNVANILLKDNKKVSVHINFLPDIDIDKMLSRKDSIGTVLKSFLNSKLVRLFLRLSSVDEEKLSKDLTDKEKDTLISILSDFKVNITGTKGFKEAQTTSGGISLKDINLETMESKLVNNLYFAGEVVDVDGDCGGYNLTFAFVSGLVVGKSVR